VDDEVLPVMNQRGTAVIVVLGRRIDTEGCIFLYLYFATPRPSPVRSVTGWQPNDSLVWKAKQPTPTSCRSSGYTWRRENLLSEFLRTQTHSHRATALRCIGFGARHREMELKAPMLRVV